MSQLDGLDTGQRWCSVLCQHSFHHGILDSFALQWFCHQHVGAPHCWDDATSFGPCRSTTLHSAASFFCSWFSTVGSFEVSWSTWLWWLLELLFGMAWYWFGCSNVSKEVFYWCRGCHRGEKQQTCSHSLAFWAVVWNSWSQEISDRWMGWPRHLSLPQNLSVFSFADFNPWRLQTEHLLTLAIFAYISQHTPMIRYPQHVSHTGLWLWCTTVVTLGVAITLALSHIVIPLERWTGCTMMTTGLPMCGVKFLNGSHGIPPMYGWFVQIVSWSGMLHLQSHQPQMLMLEIKPLNRSWRVRHDSFTRVRCIEPSSRQVGVLQTNLYCMAPVLGWYISYGPTWMNHLSRCDVLFELQAPTLYCFLIMLHGPCLSLSVYVSVHSFQWNFCCNDATSIWRFLIFWRCLIWDDAHLFPLKCWMDVFILLLCNHLHDDGNYIYLWSGSMLPVLLRRDRSKCERSGLRKPLQLEKGTWKKREISPRKLSLAYLGDILGFILKSLG